MSEWIFHQTSAQQLSMPSLVVIVGLIAVLGLVGLALLWRRGKTAEAISILNTALLIIVILLLIFPPWLS